jgi:hypothetical protein
VHPRITAGDSRRRVFMVQNEVTKHHAFWFVVEDLTVTVTRVPGTRKSTALWRLWRFDFEKRVGPSFRRRFGNSVTECFEKRT